jgi:hypothetical protein
VRDGTIHPREVKKTGAPEITAVRHFNALEKLGMPVGSGAVICLARQALPLTGNVWSMPADCV